MATPKALDICRQSAEVLQASMLNLPPPRSQLKRWCLRGPTFSKESARPFTSLGTLPQHANASECQIINSISAAALHPELKGDAKLMECRGLEDQYKQVVKVYFLQDYSYLIALESSDTKFSFFSKKITSVEQNQRRLAVCSSARAPEVGKPFELNVLPIERRRNVWFHV